MDTAYAIETVTSGALSLTIPTTYLSVTGTQAYTLAAPTGVQAGAGLRKKIVCTVAASTPAGTLTVSSPDATSGFVCQSTFFFDNVGQTLEFEWTGSAWRCINKVRTGSKNLVVGTTVTTGICNMSDVDLSVTGTVSSTTTKALPDGSAVGELCTITVTTAASTPVGTLGLTGITKAGAAGTSIASFSALTDTVQLKWTGSGWKVAAVAGTSILIS
jgi:hypothetical protein